MLTSALSSDPRWSRLRIFNRPVVVILFSAIVLLIEFYGGPILDFPVLFIFPVALAAWYLHRFLAFSLSIVQPLIRMWYSMAWSSDLLFYDALTNAIVRIFVLAAFAYLIARTARQTLILSGRVELLEGILPICCICKKIRDDNDNWETVEHYIAQRTQAHFSHGVCPECAEKHYGELFRSQE